MSIEVRYAPVSGRLPWVIVTTIRGVEVEQERHETRDAAEAAVPDVRRALRSAFRM